MSEDGGIIVPSNGEVKKPEEPEVALIVQVVMKDGQLIPLIGNGVQLRDVSHALRILNLMLDARISQKQVESNAKKVGIVPHGIMDHLRRGGFRK